MMNFLYLLSGFPELVLPWLHPGDIVALSHVCSRARRVCAYDVKHWLTWRQVNRYVCGQIRALRYQINKKMSSMLLKNRLVVYDVIYGVSEHDHSDVLWVTNDNQLTILVIEYNRPKRVVIEFYI